MLSFIFEGGRFAGKSLFSSFRDAMKFKLIHLLLAAALFGILAALLSTSMRVEIDQRLNSIAFSPDSTKIAVQGSINTQVFDINSGKKLADLGVHSTMFPGHVEFVDDQHVLSFGYAHDHRPHAIRWFHWPTQEQIRCHELLTMAEHYSPARNGFVHTDNNTQTVKFYSNDPDIEAPLVTTNMDHSLLMGMFHTSYGGPSFYNGTEAMIDGLVTPWSQSVQVADLQSYPGESASPDPIAVSELDLKILSKLAAHPLLSPDGKHFVLEWENWYSFHELDSGKIIWLKPLRRIIRSWFSLNGKYIGIESNSSDRQVIVLDAETGNQLIELETSRDHMQVPLAVSNDGKLAVARQDTSKGGVELYDLATRERLATIGVTESESRWIFVGLRYAFWLVVWSFAWAYCTPRSRKLTTSSQVVASVFWVLILALGCLLAFGFSGNVFRHTQNAIAYEFSPTAGMILSSIVLGVSAVLCLMLSAQRLIGLGTRQSDDFGTTDAD